MANEPKTWRRLFLVSSSFGMGFAVAISVIFGLATWYKSRPRAWYTDAIKGSLGTVEILTQPAKDSYVADFRYDLQNNTAKNYQLNLNDMTVMAVLTEGGGQVLSKEFGHYQTSDVKVEGPAFIPPHGKARISLLISYQYPNEFTQADKNDGKKVSASLDFRLKELSGFVLFDQRNHYRIDLPEGWKDWEDVKSK